MIKRNQVSYNDKLQYGNRSSKRPQVSSKYWDCFNKVFVLRIFEYLPFGTFGKEFLPQFLDLRLKSMKFLDNQAMNV